MSAVESTISERSQKLADQLSGSVVTPADPGWDAARRAWNLAVDQRPDLVVFPSCAADVAAAVRFAAESGLQVVPQSTGHLASSLGPLDGCLLLNVSRLGGVQVDSENRTVRAGAGAVWGEVTDAVSGHGLTALAGSSRDVGIAGYLLSGGYSWLARRHGLGCTMVTALDVVTADGRELHVTADDEPDLFWSLRGGGGNAAVVTAITFRVLPLSDVYAGMMLFPLDRAAEVLNAYEAWTRDLDESATTCVRLLRIPPLPDLPDFLRGHAFAAVDGAIDAPDALAESLLGPLRALGPVVDTFARIPTGQLGLIHLDPPMPVAGIGDGVVIDDLPADAIDALLTVAGPSVDSALLAVDLRHLGGAAGRPADGGGALDHLPGRFVVYAVGMLPGPDPAIAAALAEQVAAVRTVLAPWESARDYANMRDVRVEASRLHAPETLERLRAVKQAYDPDGVIRTGHGLA